MQHSPDARNRHVTSRSRLRKREDHRLLAKAYEPINSLYGTEHDAWITGAYLPDQVWLAALAESERRAALYEQCVPFRKWGVQ